MSTLPLGAWPLARNTGPLLSRNRSKVLCEHCRRWIGSNGLGSHQRKCAPGLPSLSRMPQGHHRCSIPGCTRYVATYADRCWRHEHKTDAARFAELDAAIAMREGREG